MAVGNALVKSHAIGEQVRGGLERACAEAKRIDREIARSLASQTGFRRLPVVHQIYCSLFRVKPLPSLEEEVRHSTLALVDTLGTIGTVIQEEEARIAKVAATLQEAREQHWDVADFLAYIESETGLELSHPGYDMKDFVAQSLAVLPEAVRKEKQEGYYTWLEGHIDLSRQYLQGLNSLAVVGGLWLGEMAKSYFDLTQIGYSLQTIRSTFEAITKGAVMSTQAQTALRSYGPALVRGMEALLDGYENLTRMRETGNSEFHHAIDRLNRRLASLSSPQLPSRDRV